VRSGSESKSAQKGGKAITKKNMRGAL